MCLFLSVENTLTEYVGHDFVITSEQYVYDRIENKQWTGVEVWEAKGRKRIDWINKMYENRLCERHMLTVYFVCCCLLDWFKLLAIIELFELKFSKKNPPQNRILTSKIHFHLKFLYIFPSQPFRVRIPWKIDCIVQLTKNYNFW